MGAGINDLNLVIWKEDTTWYCLDFQFTLLIVLVHCNGAYISCIHVIPKNCLNNETLCDLSHRLECVHDLAESVINCMGIVMLL